MLGELGRNLVEDRHHLVCYLTCIVEDVITIDCQHITFSSIYGIKVFGLNILFDGLRHSSNYHIETESIHCLTMESLSHRLPLYIHFPYQVHQHIITCSPKKLFKVHRVHLNRTFFRWEHDALCVFLDTYQRSRLNVVISSVGHQKLDGCSRSGA